MDFSAIKTLIQQNIRTNNNEDITGSVLQNVLLSIIDTLGDNAINDLATDLDAEKVKITQIRATIQDLLNGGYLFAGIADPAVSPGTPLVSCFYIATEAGTYTNFRDDDNDPIVISYDALYVLTYEAVENHYWECNKVSNLGDGVFDISAYHNGQTYATLSDALGPNGNNVPLGLRKGGMSVKYVQSSDNKYVQYRLMNQSFTITESDWQGVDAKIIAGSKNLIESGGVELQSFVIPTTVNIQNLSVETGFIGSTKLEDIIISETHLQHYVMTAYAGNISIKANPSHQCLVAFVKSLPSLGGIMDFCDGCSRIIMSAGTSATYVVPSDCNYILISKDGGTTDILDYSPSEIIKAGFREFFCDSIVKMLKEKTLLYSVSLIEGNELFSIDFANNTITTKAVRLYLSTLGHSNDIPNITYVNNITESTIAIDYTATDDHLPYWLIFDISTKQFKLLGHNNSQIQHKTDNDCCVVGFGTKASGLIIFSNYKYEINGVEYPRINVAEKEIDNIKKLSLFSCQPITLAGNEITGFIAADKLQDITVGTQHLQSYLLENTFVGIQVTKLNSSPFAILAFLRESPVLGQNFNFCVGTSRIVINDSAMHEYVIPRDCKYIIISKDRSANNEVQDATPITQFISSQEYVKGLLENSAVYDIPAKEVTTRFEDFKNYDIIGANKILSVLKDSSGVYSTPPVEVSGGKISNVTILENGGIASAEANCAYCVHSDSDNNIDNEIIVSDCIFDSNSNACWGVGTRIGYEMIFMNCIFIQRATEDGMNSGNQRCWYSHNTNKNGASYDKSQKSKVSFINCQFISINKAPMYLQDWSTNGNEGENIDFCEWEFIGCTFSFNGSVNDAVTIDYKGGTPELNSHEFKRHFILSEKSKGNNVAWLNYEPV